MSSRIFACRNFRLFFVSMISTISIFNASWNLFVCGPSLVGLLWWAFFGYLFVALPSRNLANTVRTMIEGRINTVKKAEKGASSRNSSKIGVEALDLRRKSLAT